MPTLLQCVENLQKTTSIASELLNDILISNEKLIAKAKRFEFINTINKQHDNINYIAEQGKKA